MIESHKLNSNIGTIKTSLVELITDEVSRSSNLGNDIY